MKNYPLVSVIITTYNRAHLVHRALEGVFSQDYPNIELIVVDDYSTDNTEAYFQKNWTSKLTYIRHEKNMGVQHASNTGFSIAKGKYLAFIGDDDQWSNPSKLTQQVKIFEEDRTQRYGIITTSVKIIRPDKSFDKIIRKPRNLLRHLMSHNGIIYGSAALLRRDAFEHAGKFAPDLPKGTDSDVYRRITILGYDTFFIQKPMVDYYEDSPDRMTLLNEKAILRSIEGVNYQFKNYPQYLNMFPRAKSSRYSSLGFLYKKLYQLRGNKSLNNRSRLCYWNSWKAFPWNPKPLILFFLLLFKS